tara:strand:+ start:2354 stop:2788 length:435 start_codon:yes stop_codon:yes gene_type:complete
MEITDIKKEELKKFFYIAAIHNEDFGENIKMPSCVIDSYWHDLLKNKEGYKQFSLDACGKELKHKKDKGEGILSWVETYERIFGKLPDVWFIAPNGEFQEDVYRSYIKTGVVKMSWDCEPTTGDKDDDGGNDWPSDNDNDSDDD